MQSLPQQIGPKQLIFLAILIYLDFLNIWKILKPISGFPGSSVVKNLPAMQVTGVQSLGWEDPLEEEIATHSILMPEKSQGKRSLMGYSPWGHKRNQT